MKALGWRGDASQTKRFEVLAGIGDLDGCAVLDIGCGYGDLKGFLDSEHTNFTYIGIDHMPEFISMAKARYGSCSNTHFFQADFTTAKFPEVDYVLASGAFNYRCASQHFHCDMIEKMYATATRAIVFNMLRADRFTDNSLLLAHKVEAIVSFCKTLSPAVKVIEDYLPDDFTVFMYKPGAERTMHGIPIKADK